jgi:hypothetical protein
MERSVDQLELLESRQALYQNLRKLTAGPMSSEVTFVLRLEEVLSQEMAVTRWALETLDGDLRPLPKNPSSVPAKAGFGPTTTSNPSLTPKYNYEPQINQTNL